MADASRKSFATTRRLDAPLDDVWAAWSEAERLEAWWGPKGCKLKAARLEFRPGGFFHYSMTYPTGARMWGRFVYREIEAPGRIVWLNSFSNEGCGITRAPFSPVCPLEFENTVTLTADGRRTRLDIRSLPHGASPEEWTFFEGLLPSIEQGYGGTLDQLEAALARR